MKKFIDNFRDLKDLCYGEKVTVMGPKGDSVLGCEPVFLPEQLTHGEVLTIITNLKSNQYWYEKSEKRDMIFSEICELLVKNPRLWVMANSNSTAKEISAVYTGSELFNIDESSYTVSELSKDFKYSTDLKEWHEFRKEV